MKKYEKSALKHTYGSVVLAAMEEYASLSSVKEVEQGIATTGDFKEDVLLPETTAEEYFENRKRTISGEDFLDKEDFLSFVAMEEYKSAPDPTDKTEGEDELWGELLTELPKICMYAPLGEPERHREIISKLKSQFSITRKP